ncbi:unnamed protein product [Lasius platythorax]|uniref:Uncharacterized protein n=1 Tax=Lasius platythorax TaxID=488582 RepID=A0AAV2P3M1_9HYME
MLIDRMTPRVNRRPQQGIRLLHRDIHFRRPVSASIGQGRSHGSRGQVDKSPFPARRSGGGEREKKASDSAREGGEIDGDEAQRRRKSGFLSPRFEVTDGSDLTKGTISQDLLFPTISSSWSSTIKSEFF